MRSIIYLVRSTMENAQLIAQQVKATNRWVEVPHKPQLSSRDSEQAFMRRLSTVCTVGRRRKALADVQAPPTSPSHCACCVPAERHALCAKCLCSVYAASSFCAAHRMPRSSHFQLAGLIGEYFSPCCSLAAL